MAPPVVELLRIEHDFGERRVLRGVELRVEPAASLALFGENGAGKTTLLRVVAGLLRPTRGEARLDDVPAPAAGPALRGRIGFLSHRPLVWDGLTASENLRARRAPVRARRRGGARSARASRACRPGRHAGSRPLAGPASAPRRGACARREPDLLLLDEPHAGLDAAGSELLDGLIEGLRGSATILLATHDHERGRRLCGSALTLRDGRLAR